MKGDSNHRKRVRKDYIGDEERDGKEDQVNLGGELGKIEKILS